MSKQVRYTADSIEKACECAVQTFGDAIGCVLDDAGSESAADEFTTFDLHFWSNLRSILEIYREEELHIDVEDNPAALAVWDAIFKPQSDQAPTSNVINLKRKGRA